MKQKNRTVAKITLRDVARLADVSIGTASRVLNRNSTVSQEVRRRVEQAIAELRYEPDLVAQSMRRGQTHTIGVIVRDISIPALAGFVRAVQESAHGAGYTVLITCSEDQKDRELGLLQLLAQRRVDGLIMTTSSERDRDLQAAREALDLPIVMLDREVEDEVDAVVIDHRSGLRKALDHLKGLGHQRIGMITGGMAVYPGRERLEGYKEWSAKYGHPIDPELVRARSFDDGSAYLEASALLDLPRPPTAIIVGGIAMLAGTLRACITRGLRIPQDISIIAAADSDLASLHTPPITIIRWDYAELGRTCARLLLERMSGDGTPTKRRIVYPTEFVIRESCSAPGRRDDARAKPD